MALNPDKNWERDSQERWSPTIAKQKLRQTHGDSSDGNSSNIPLGGVIVFYTGI